MWGLDSRWVKFKYERLLVFYYLCGRIDHNEKDCIEWIRIADSINLEDKRLAACNPRSVTENACGAWAANWGESKSWADGGEVDKTRALA